VIAPGKYWTTGDSVLVGRGNVALWDLRTRDTGGGWKRAIDVANRDRERWGKAMELDCVTL